MLKSLTNISLSGFFVVYFRDLACQIKMNIKGQKKPLCSDLLG
jgi:hypothetical protein